MSVRSTRIRSSVANRRPMAVIHQTTAPKLRKTGDAAGAAVPEPPAPVRLAVYKPNTQSLQEYLIYWLHNVKRGALKPTSYDTLERVVLSYIQGTELGATPLSRVTPELIQGHLLRLKDDDYSYSTCKKVYDCLGASLRYACQRKLLRDNPMDLVTMPNRALFDAAKVTYFTAAESKLILEECFRTTSTGELKHWYGPCFALLLLSGLRAGELLGLHKDDFDAERAVLSVRRSVCKVRNRDSEGNVIPGFTLQETTTKSYSGTREIPLTPQAVLAIEHLMSRTLYGSERLVLNSKGNMPSHEQIGRSFHNLLRAINLQPTGVHTLRHTYASLLFAARTDIKSISSLLGHASATITLGIYIHIADTIPHSVVDPLEVLLGVS